MSRFRHVVAAELTKVRTVRSTAWALLLTPVSCVVLGYFASFSLRASFPSLPLQQRQDWDPLFATFYSLSMGQIALVVFGVTVAGGEYPTRLIMTSLTVVPQRGLFYAAKVTAGLLAAGAAALLAVTGTFFAAQSALGPLGARAGAPATLQAALGAWLYLTLICALAMGLAAASRSPVLSLAVMVPLLFLDSQGLGNVPGLQRVIDYLPDQAGALITHFSGVGAGHFARPYGPWTGMGIMAAWTAAALAGGYLVLARTDVSGGGPRRWRPASGAS
jgi:ABC-type transport system involved in multi-copper enzyme maturation permease subunit